jgi:glycogen(starch) synthase
VTSRALSICIVSQEYPAETGWGGMGTYAHEMAHGLARAGHRVVVLSRALEAARQYVESDGVDVYRVLPRFGVSHIPFFWRLNRVWEGYQLAVATALHRITFRHRVEVIEAPDLLAEPLLYALSRRSGPPLVARLHSGNRSPHSVVQHRSMRQRHNDLEERLWLRLAALITAPSRAVAECRTSKFALPPARYRVVPNPVDTNFLHPSRSPDANPNFTILFLGRFESVKGIDILLKAIPQVCDAVPQVRFRLVGAGMGRGSAKDLDFAIGSSVPDRYADSIEVLPPVPRTDLPTLYGHADLCVVPSRWEAFGYTCAEAMSCGVPVVASRTGGLTELVEHEVSGLLVAPEDPAALAQGLVTLLRQPDHRIRMGQAARRRAESMFSTTAVVSRTADLYADLIDSNRPRHALAPRAHSG